MTRHPEPAAIVFRGASGNKLTGDVFGSSGPPVLMLHGGGQTRHAWRKTAETVARLGRHSQRPEGLDAIRPAGGAKTSQFSVSELDRLQREQPRSYARLIEANPDLDYFHMSGGDTAG